MLGAEETDLLKDFLYEAIFILGGRVSEPC